MKLKKSSEEMNSFISISKKKKKVCKRLQKLLNWETSQAESLRETILFLMNFYLICLNFLLTKMLLLMDFIMLTLSLFTRKITISIKIIRNQLVYYWYYRKLLKLSVRSNLWVYRYYIIISLSCHEQVCLSGHLNILVHDMINLL